MSSVAGSDAVAVSVKELSLFSAIEFADVVRVINGTSSSSSVNDKLEVDPAVASAPDSVPSDTTIVSGPSDRPSSVGVRFAVSVVAPAEIVISLIVA